jgi:UDP:flavonoid glycosyltransferase YjiC (YdhE family)
MQFVVAAYGSRGDVEPCAAVAAELRRRGHDVRIAVPPNLIGLIASAGLTGVAYGPDSREEMNPGSDLVRNIAPKMQNPFSVVPEVVEHVTEVKLQKSATLSALAKGADMVLASFNEQGVAANVAEYHGIPVAAVHPFPNRIWSSDWLFSRMTKAAEDAQRQVLGLPGATGPVVPSLAMQAYDEFCLPQPAAQWVDVDPHHPFVGALTLELSTDADDEVLSWIAEGTPPVYFGFGSTPIPPAGFAMISAACAQLRERLLICSGPNEATVDAQSDHVKVVAAVNHSAVFPACHAAVHHGGAGTTAAALRAGIPTLILWQWLDQPLWAAAVEHLEVGFGRRFSDTTTETLVADLRVLLSPHYRNRAGEIAVRMTKPAESLAKAADLLEACLKR